MLKSSKLFPNCQALSARLLADGVAYTNLIYLIVNLYYNLKYLLSSPTSQKSRLSQESQK
jgi:hypothetical protein